MTAAIVFPGQGAQVVGMGQSFHAASAAARRIFQQADELLGLPLTRLCFEGPRETLEQTDVCQPAILTCSVAIVVAMEELGSLRRSDFAATAGLSLGEYTALWFAEVLAFDDALRLVRLRGQEMQRASDLVPSGMTAFLGATLDSVEAVCSRFANGEVLVPANLLCDGNLVVSGHRTALDRAEAGAREFGVRKTVRLPVAGAFHSPLMEPACEKLRERLASTRLAAPRIPVLSNVTAEAQVNADTVRATLVRQVTQPVLWAKCVAEMAKRGCTEFWEPGPGTVLTSLFKKIDRNLVARSFNSFEEANAFKSVAQGPGG